MVNTDLLIKGDFRDATYIWNYKKMFFIFNIYLIIFTQY